MKRIIRIQISDNGEMHSIMCDKVVDDLEEFRTLIMKHHACDLVLFTYEEE